jgi:PKD repeat protein
MKRNYLPLLIVLALTLTVALAYSEDYTTGLGVSDYEARPRIIIGHTSRFEVARVSNQGTLNLTLTPIFVPDYNTTDGGITMVFTPNTTELAPQEDIIIQGEVTEATKLGTFQGKVDFKCSVNLPNASGNPSIPGGSAKVFITIVEVPPVANFTWNPVKPEIGKPVSFDASSSQRGWNGTGYVPISLYQWDFGDGNTSIGLTASHVYSEAGNFTVTLNITDNYEHSILTKQIQVGQSSVAGLDLLAYLPLIGIAGAGPVSVLVFLKLKRKSKLSHPPKIMKKIALVKQAPSEPSISDLYDHLIGTQDTQPTPKAEPAESTYSNMMDAFLKRTEDKKNA